MKAVRTKLSNKALIENAFKSIEDETGYHIIDKYYYDGYFVSMKQNICCNFKIKEIPDWTFGIWNTCQFDDIKKQYQENELGMNWADYNNVSPRSELIFFTQFTEDLDKFKPSHSDYVEGIYRDAWYNYNEANHRIKEEEWHLGDIPEILKFLHNHPMRAWYYTCTSYAIWEQTSDLKILRAYLKHKSYLRKSDKKKRREIKQFSKKSVQLCKKFKTLDYFVEIRDKIWPEIEISVTTRDTSNKELLEKDFDLLDEFRDKYCHKVSITECLYYTENPTKEEKKKDDRFHKHFYERLNNLLDVIEGKSDKTLEDYWTKELLSTNVKRKEDK